MECRSLEEYIRGPEGDGERAFVGALRRASDAGRNGGHTRVQLEVRVTPNGEASRQEATYTCQVDDSPDAVASRLLELLTDSPGESFAGELRVNFRAHGDSRTHFGSYTRRLRPVTGPGLPDSGNDGGGGDDSPVFWERIARSHAQLALEAIKAGVAQATGGATLMGGASTLMLNHARATGRALEAPAPKGPSSGVVHDLLRGVLKVGEAAAGADSKAGRAAAAGAAVLEAAGAPAPDLAPPGEVPTFGGFESPAPDAAPAPSGEQITPEAAEAWARANPEAARAMAFKLMQEGL